MPKKASFSAPENAHPINERNKLDAMFNLALLLQRTNQYAEAADYWRRYLASDGQSEWAARARRSLKFCEMQLHLVASA
jgi:hypothetical protein